MTASLSIVHAFKTAIFVAVTALMLPACTTIDLPPPQESSTGGAAATAPRNLFVLFDGTRNDAASRTNVVRMKEAIAASKVPAVVSYFEGVGSAQDAPALEALLGQGMEDRINGGYRFLSNHHRPGDRIFILGFSRGAHQARALAGLIAYSGLLDGAGMDERRQRKLANAVIEVVKGYTDDDTEAEWLKAPFEPPARMRLQQELSIKLRPVPIAFLGVWDTVPGSWFKEYGTCRELPDKRAGDRYKTGSYPSIARIAHAVALDEKRSKFRPILLCPPMLSDATRISEVWFAGAHADVGGGYEPATGSLSNVSLSWMAGELSTALGATVPVPAAADEDRLAAVHWSIGDSPANIGSQCEDRKSPTGATIHSSVGQLRAAGSARLIVQGVSGVKPYPPSCADHRP